MRIWVCDRSLCPFPQRLVIFIPVVKEVGGNWRKLLAVDVYLHRDKRGGR